MNGPFLSPAVLWLATVASYALIVFGLVGFNVTACITFGGLVCISTAIILWARRA